MEALSRANDTKFMFWNIRKGPVGSIVAAASQQYNLDIILLAECDDPEPILLELNQSTERPFIHQKTEAGRVDMFNRFTLGIPQILGDYSGISFIHLQHPVGQDILLAALHLSSKRYMHDDEQMLHCTRLIEKVNEFEAKLGHNRTVVVGDFNINPFEHGLIAAECFHASLSRQIAQRKRRMVQQTDYTFFYNPMWAHFGDRASGPPGTYYYSASTSTNMFWNMFDQVLIRPDLLDSFDDKSIQILTKVGQIDLANRAGKPKTSDHFPILFSLNLLEE